jgi:hypothetical protein
MSLFGGSTMKKTILIILILAFIVSVSAQDSILTVPSIFGELTVEAASKKTYDDLLQMRVNTAVDWQANKFFPSLSGRIANVYLLIAKVGSPTGKIWTQICSDSLGITVLATSDSINVSTLTTSPVLRLFTYTNDCSLTVSTKYWLKFNGDYTRSASHYAQWYIKKGAGGTFGYFNGTALVIPYNTADGYYIVNLKRQPLSAGQREWQHLAAYSAYDSVRHVVYLPTDYNTETYYPLLIELPGNMNNAAGGTVDTGLPIIGYGLTRGVGAIWANTPFLTTDGDSIAYSYWGNSSALSYPSATITYIYALLDTLIKSYHIDTNRILLLGFSRGGQGISNVGLAQYDTLYKKFQALWYCSGTDGYQWYTYVNYSERNKRMRNEGGIPALMTYGENDAALLPESFNRTDSILHQTFKSPTTRITIPGYGHNNTWCLDTSLTIGIRKWYSDVFKKINTISYTPTSGRPGDSIHFTATHGLRRYCSITIGGTQIEIDTIRYDTSFYAYVPKNKIAGVYNLVFTSPDTTITWVNGFTIDTAYYDTTTKVTATVTIPASSTTINNFTYYFDLTRLPGAFRSKCRGDLRDIQVSRAATGLLHSEVINSQLYFTDTLSSAHANVYTISGGSGKRYRNDREVWTKSDFSLVRHYEDSTWFLTDALGISYGTNAYQDTMAGVKIYDTGYLGHGIKVAKTAYIYDWYQNEMDSTGLWTFQSFVNITDLNNGLGHFIWLDDGGTNIFDIRTVTDSTFWTIVYAAGVSNYYAEGKYKAIKSGGWHLVTWVYDGANGKNDFYIDSTKVTMTTIAGALPAKLPDNFGRTYPSLSSVYLAGNFDEMRQGKRLMDSAEVMAYYHNLTETGIFGDTVIISFSGGAAKLYYYYMAPYGQPPFRRGSYR